MYRIINLSEKPLKINIPCGSILWPHHAHAMLEAILPGCFLPISVRQMRALLATPPSSGSDVRAFAMLHGLLNSLSVSSLAHPPIGQEIRALDAHSFKLVKADKSISYSRVTRKARIQDNYSAEFVHLWFDDSMPWKSVAERVDLDFLFELAEDGFQQVILRNGKVLRIQSGFKTRLDVEERAGTWVFKSLDCRDRNIGLAGLQRNPGLAKIIETMLERFNRRYFEQIRQSANEFSIVENIRNLQDKFLQTRSRQWDQSHQTVSLGNESCRCTVIWRTWWAWY